MKHVMPDYQYNFCKAVYPEMTDLQIACLSGEKEIITEATGVISSLRARIAELEKIREEWSERFGFLATENPRNSIESIDEVACKIFEKESMLRARIAELEKILKKTRERRLKNILGQ